VRGGDDRNQRSRKKRPTFFESEQWTRRNDERRAPVSRRTVSRRAASITLRVIDPEVWSALCWGLRERAEARLVEVGEMLAAFDLRLKGGEELAAREYELALDAYTAAGKLFDDAAEPPEFGGVAALAEALDAYTAAGKLFDDAAEPPEFGGVAALADIAAAHFAAAVAKHEGRPVPGRPRRCFYNPLHGQAAVAPSPVRKPKKNQRKAPQTPQKVHYPMCSECRDRSRANLPLDVLPVAITVRTGRRGTARVAAPYFLAGRSLWAATGYGSLPGSSDAEFVSRVLRGEYRPAGGAGTGARRSKRRWWWRRGA
jgi:hypothetical protein